MENLNAKLAAIQAELKAPKNQYNSFGKYNYRSCEDILEAVKPLVHAQGCTVIVSDRMEEVGGKVYLIARASLSDGTDTIHAEACAREANEQKGMNDAQITGSTSSYARKYALNGLFCIDDTKDSDATNDHGKTATAKAPVNQEPPVTPATLKKFDELLALTDNDTPKFWAWASCTRETLSERRAKDAIAIMTKKLESSPSA